MGAGGQRAARAGLPREIERMLHDLRGPLNSLVMHAEVLKHACAADAVARRTLDLQERDLHRLARMLSAAFSVVALERQADTTAGLRTIVEEARAGLGPATVTVVGDDWPDVRGDRGLLVLAIEHLLRNALEATAEGAPAPEVSVAVDAGSVTLTVRDWGAGLRGASPRSAMRLAESTKPGGQGVGLLAVERIARLHGGTVEFVAPGAGTEVRLMLPRS
jgi:signal transduction histidine kinase